MTSTPHPADIHLISSMATRETLNELIKLFEQTFHWRIKAESGGGVEMTKRVQANEPVDLVVLASASIDQLIAEGKLLAETRTDLVSSGIGIAVRAGARRFDIGSAEAVRDALLLARTVGYSTGPSGTYLLKMFQTLGVPDALKVRLIQAPPGVPVASLIARDEVELGFQQVSELINAPGIELLGQLPAALQSVTTFTAAATTWAKNRQAIAELMQFMNNKSAEAVKRRFGMEPIRLGPVNTMKCHCVDRP